MFLPGLWRWRKRFTFDNGSFPFAGLTAPWSNNFGLCGTGNFLAWFVKLAFGHIITSLKERPIAPSQLYQFLEVIVIIPNNIKIGGLTVTVEEKDNLASNRDKFGEYSFMEQKIIIDGSLPQDKKEETLIHEIIEALSGYYSLNLEHRIISVLGFGLYQVLKENKLSF